MDKDLAKSRLAVDPVEAGFVRRIYTDYMTGAGAKSIAKELNQEGFLHRGRRWTKNNVLAIIGDESYVGRYYFNKTSGREKKPNPKSDWILIPIDPIVDEPTWKRAKIMKESRNPITARVNPSATTSKTFLTGIAKCGLCGTSFAVETAKGGRHTYYNCANYFRKGRSTCPGQRIAADKLEAAVIDHLTARLFSKDRLKKLLAGVYKQVGQANNRADANHNRLVSQLNDVKHRLTRQYEAIESGLLDLELVAERIRELKNKKDTLESSIDRLSRTKPPPPHLFRDETIEQFQEIVGGAFRNGSNRRTVKRYLRLFIERITIRLPVVEIEANTKGILATIQNK